MPRRRARKASILSGERIGRLGAKPPQVEDGFDLKAFLDDQTNEGVVDSRGAFTVAREKALQKLAHFALPSEYDWVLKIVQAANLWGVPKLQVRQSRVATSFLLCPPPGQAFPSETSIVEALNSPVLDNNLPVHQLAMALRSLVQQAGLSFVLAVRQHGELGKPIFAGDDVSKTLDSDARTEWTRLDREGVRLTVSHFRGNESLTGRYIPTFSRQVRRDISIARILEQRSFASAVPIEIDGRMIARVFPKGEYHETRRQRPLMVGHLCLGSEEELRVEKLDLISGYLQKSHLSISATAETSERIWFCITTLDWSAMGAAYQALSHLLIPAGTVPRMQSHSLHWVRHGVVIETMTFPAGFDGDVALSIFLPASHLRTDLSGLQIELDRKEPGQAYPALAAIRDELSRFLQGADLNKLLSTAPEMAANPGPAKVEEATTSAEELLSQAGETVFTGSLRRHGPSANTQILYLIDSASRLLEHLPLHSQRMERWAKATLRDVTNLYADLGSNRKLTRHYYDP